MNATQEEVKWERAGRMAYTLMHHGWYKGERQLRNRYYFQVEYDRATLTERDGDAMAEHIVRAVTAHNKLVEVLKAVRDLIKEDRHIPLFLVEMALLEAGEPV